MKKLFIILSFGGLGLLASCGGGGNDKNAETESRKDEAKEEAKEEPAENPDYEKGLELVGKNDCLTCHKINEASTGPAYSAVAAKYPNTPQVIDTLSNKVIKGGAGNWGVVPMTPHPNLSKEDAVAMVKYVLSLKK
ncbi:c-type cytochrome [Segetibacter koreensis]|uniref:c-type cytochrome n=1 Tax=Segetibacter koreensis TaxID=398037 RepID=UPI0003633A4F|nr:c-type cytochrome [Segetibacter koreensis]